MNDSKPDRRRAVQPRGKGKQIKRLLTIDHDGSRMSTCKTTSKQCSKGSQQCTYPHSFEQLERRLTISQLAQLERRRQLTKQIQIFKWQQHKSNELELLQKELMLEQDWRQIRKQNQRLFGDPNTRKQQLSDRYLSQRKELLARMTDLHLTMLQECNPQ